MRVAIFTNSVLWGGLEVHTVALAESLLAAGHEVVVVCFGDGAYALYRPRMPEHAEMIDLGGPDHRSLAGWRRALKSIDADAAILEKGTLWTGSLSLDVALRIRYGRYFTIQNLEPPELPGRTSSRHLGGLLPGVGLWWFRWKWAGRLRAIVPRLTFCVSEGVRQRFIRDYGVPPHKVVTVHNGVDPSKFGADPQARRAVRLDWAIPDDAFVFGSVARLSVQKGLDTAIEAFAQLIRQGGRGSDRVYLVLVGDGDERARLAGLVERFGLVGRVIMPGFARETSRVYQAIDVFLIPSRFEGLPFALVEAMASGCEVVGSNAGGIPEATPDCHRAGLVSPENPDALCAAMQNALTRDPADRANRIAIARQHVTEHFDIRRQCLKIESTLRHA